MNQLISYIVISEIGIRRIVIYQYVIVGRIN